MIGGSPRTEEQAREGKENESGKQSYFQNNFLNLSWSTASTFD